MNRGKQHSYTAHLLLRYGLLVVALLLTTPAMALPYDLSYASRITDTQGRPIAGPISVQIDFFTDASDPNTRIDVPAIVKSDVALSDGVFQLSIEMTPENFHRVFSDSSGSVYIQVTDKTHGKTYQRQQFSAAPYALKVPIDPKVLSYTSDGLLTISAGKASGTGQVLSSDASGNLKWTSLSTVLSTTTAPSSGQVLAYDGAGWVSQNLPLSSGGAAEPPITNGNTAQYWRGDKTWQTLNTATVPESGTALYYSDVRARAALSGSAPVAYSLVTGALSISQANSSSHGYLSSSDWTAFHSKQNALGFTPVDKAGDAMSGPLDLSSFDLNTTGNIQMAPSKTLMLSNNSADPAGLTAADGGKTWFNTQTKQIKYWDGTSAITLGASGIGQNAVTAGTGISVANNAGTATLSLANVGSAGTFAKVIVNSQGQVIGNRDLLEADIPPLSANKISGQLAATNGGTGVATASANTVFAGPTSGNGTPTFRALVANDYPIMGGANGTLAGTAGAVPGPAATDNVKFLRGDRTWATPPAVAAGANYQVQFNNGGLLTADQNFVYNGNNVGIGTTSPFGPLDVVTGSGSGTHFIVSNNGNVGIGTSSPGAVLDIQGTPYDTGSNRFLVKIMDNDSTSIGAGGGLVLGGLFNGTANSTPTSLGQFVGIRAYRENMDYSTANNWAASMVFTTREANASPSEKMRITSQGRVGIGSTFPAVALDVNGAIRPGSSTTVTTCSAATEGSQRYNYANHTMEYCNGSSWIAVKSNATPTCPAGYILVPKDDTFSSKDFCIMKYEAKKDATTGLPVSAAAGTPFTSISWYEAKDLCQRIGAHLMTEGEWMTTARNIEATAINDIDASTGIQLATGHSDNSPSSSIAASTEATLTSCTLTYSLADAANASCSLRTDTSIYTGTGQSYATTGYVAGGSNTSQMRTHVLSNGNVVWDLSGNAWEWTDMQCTSANWNSNNGYIQWSNAGLTAWEKKIAGPNNSLTSANGAGQYYGCTTAGSATLRGASWYDSSNAGIYAIGLSGIPTGSTTATGFRCAILP